MTIDPTIVVALISLIGTVIVAILNQGKQSKSDAVALEHRITKLEERDGITVDERRCLIENTLKIKFLFDYFVGDAAKGLKNPAHIDAALTKIENNGFTGYIGLSNKEKDDIEAYARKLLKDGRVSDLRKQRARLILGLRELEKTLEEQNLVDCE